MTAIPTVPTKRLRTVFEPALAPVRVKRPANRYPGTDSVKWVVRNAVGKVVASGLSGYKAAVEAADKLGFGTPARS